MRPVVVDASALAALVFGEPEADRLAARLEGAAVFAPALLPFELASAAREKAQRHPDLAPAILRALSMALDPRRGIEWMRVDHADAVMLALATGLTPYEASYLWLAGWLGAELVTLDRRLAAAVTPR
jgi:predicted nucleic acid-binding protein